MRAPSPVAPEAATTSPDGIGRSRDSSLRSKMTRSASREPKKLIDQIFGDSEGGHGGAPYYTKNLTPNPFPRGKGNRIWRDDTGALALTASRPGGGSGLGEISLLRVISDKALVADFSSDR